MNLNKVSAYSVNCIDITSFIHIIGFLHSSGSQLQLSDDIKENSSDKYNEDAQSFL